MELSRPAPIPPQNLNLWFPRSERISEALIVCLAACRPFNVAEYALKVEAGQ